jgi:hypothetical protein
MSVLHCPLCIGLAVLSTLRAMAHLTLILRAPLLAPLQPATYS